ncbi:MAG: hypothetical protein KDB65_08695 [Calditrichaeota bacterium]|nr:hypothetical protein [Calditrichota bacterium]MCB9369786.1 hypothetical protein [Calditrichota bacterium]
MRARILLLSLAALMMIGERGVLADSAQVSEVRGQRLRTELQKTNDSAKQRAIRKEISQRAQTRERRDSRERLDQGGETCSLPTDLTGMPIPIVVSGTTIDFADDYNCAGFGPAPPPCWTGYYDQLTSCSGPDVVYRFTPPADGDYRFSLCNSDYDTGILIFNDNCPPNFPTDFVCGNDDYCNVQTEIVSLSLTSSQPILVIIDGWNGDAGNYELVIDFAEPPPPNDDCFGAQFIEAPSLVSGSTANATYDDAPFVCGGSVIDGPGVWYTTLGTGNTMTVNTCLLDGYDTQIAVYQGGCTGLTCVDGNDQFCLNQSQVTWCSQAGEQYFILVHGYQGQAGDFVLELTDDGIPCGGTTPVLSILEVYENLPDLVGQQVTIRGFGSGPNQGIITETEGDWLRNTELEPYSALKVVGLDPWNIYIPELMWGQYIEVQGIIGAIPISPDVPPGYEATIEVNAPAVVVPSTPHVPVTQGNWRPANWTPDTTNCDTCNFGMFISGGIDSANNRDDYWDDLVDFYCYKTGAGYCPQNINIYYFKGDTLDGRIPPARVDSCTQAKIQARINAIASKVKACKDAGKTPKVEIVVTNHGKHPPNGGINILGRDGAGSSNAISPHDFTSMIQTLCDSGAANIEIELGECFSGQMVNHLRDSLDTKGANVTAASAAPDSLSSWSKGKKGGWNRWLNPLVCARYSGESLPEAIRRANQSYDSSLVQLDSLFRAWAAYLDSLGTHGDSVKAAKYRRWASDAINGKGGETVWFSRTFKESCNGDTISVSPGGRLEFTYSGPNSSCGNSEIICKNTAGHWINYRHWNWNVPGSAGYHTGNNVRTLDAGAGHTGLYVIHSLSDSFRVSIKSINPPLPPSLLTSASNPEDYAGFGVGWTSGNSDEFGAINTATLTLPDVDDDGFDLSTAPKLLGPGGVGQLFADFDVLAENYWWTDMRVYMRVLGGTAGVTVTADCPDCEFSNVSYDLAGGDEKFYLNLGSINVVGSHTLSLTATGTTELDCWGLESAHSTGTPLPVTDLVIIRDGDNINLHWSAVPLAVSYLVQRAASENGPWATIGLAFGTTFVHTGQAASSDEQLYYQVIAVSP